MKQLIKKIINWFKLKKELKERIKEMKKNDPFIYK